MAQLSECDLPFESGIFPDAPSMGPIVLHAPNRSTPAPLKNAGDLAQRGLITFPNSLER